MIDKIKIQQEAEKLLNGISYKFPIPAEKIANTLGFSCYLFEPNQGTANISGAVDHANKKIFINANDSPRRQLFTLAHEIGHIVLHPKDEDYIDYRDNSISNDSKETEANIFAANLLMPEKIFHHQWKKLNGDFNELSRFFGPSTSSIAIRADSLGLID